MTEQKFPHGIWIERDKKIGIMLDCRITWIARPYYFDGGEAYISIE